MKIKLLNLLAMMFVSLSALAQQNESQVSSKNTLIVYLFGTLNLVFLIVIVFLLVKFSRLSSESAKKERRNSTFERSLSNEIKELRIVIDNSRKDTEYYKERYENRVDQDYQNETKIENLERKVKMYEDAASDRALPVELGEAKKSDLFPIEGKELLAKCEQADGRFYLKQTERSDRKTLYRIIESEGRFLFTIDLNNTEAVKNALSFYDVYVDGYCESSNAFQEEFSFIEVLSGGEGKLVKEGDRFRVLEKLKVKFR